MSTVHVNAESFADTVKNGIVILDWWASWCGPCVAFAPIFEEAAEEHPDVVFGKINTDEELELSGAFAVQSIPTLMIFRDGILLFNQPPRPSRPRRPRSKRYDGPTLQGMLD